MPIQTKLYRVLIASPRDVTRERNIVRQEIARWNSMHAEDLQMILSPVGWETDATPDLQERGQAVINRQLVDSCDLLIGIFRTRLGTPTPQAESGTVEEIERADNEGKRCIVYFSDKVFQLSNGEQEQYERLQNYRKELNARGLTDSYITTNDFREKVSRHLTTAIREIAKEDRERRAADNEARSAEQAIGITLPHLQQSYQRNISFNTFSEAQASIKLLLESRFGVQDMEDAKEQEIGKIQSVLSSPDLAELLSRQANAESISAIAQILETATTPSMYALAAISRYADETSLEWLDIIGDWIERLSTRKIESGYRWASYIKTYPGLLGLYAVGISALRAAKLQFLQEVVDRSVYSNQYSRDDRLLDATDPRYVFYDNISGMIEPGFERRFTPVSDHLAPLFKDKLYPREEEARYLNWFDLFEFLLSLKSVQQLDERPYFGSFTWRWETNRFVFKAIQDAAIQYGRYGEDVCNFFGGQAKLEETSARYDSIAAKSQRGFGRGGPPSYITQLIQLAKSGVRVSSYEDLVRILQANK